MPPPLKASAQPTTTGEGPKEDWVSTEEMCLALDICRSTLYRVRTADGLMAEGVHFIRKNPTSIRCGHLLWNPAEVAKVFGRSLP